MIYEKYRLTIEFRFHRQKDGKYITKQLDIGEYSTFDDACFQGNLLLEKMEGRFERHKYPNGDFAPKQRLGITLFENCKIDLVAESAYLKTPFSFFMKVTPVTHGNFDNYLNTILSDCHG